MKQFKTLIVITIAIFLSSCGTLKKGFQNPKKNSSDEFLVEKKAPLVMPPDFNELPIPQEKNVNNENNENEIKKLMLKNEGNMIKNEISENNSSIENSLLKKIKDN